MPMTTTEAETQTKGRRLEGRVAIITGGAGGIGLATAKLFASEGAKLVLVDVDEAQVQSAAAQAAGPNAIGVKANVTKLEDAENAVKAATEKFGKVDILINNAGITRDNLLIRMSEEDWDLVLDVNLKGAFAFSKAVAKPMMKARYGRIVNVASVVGMMGNSGQANYAASKGGLIAMTKAMAKELATRNITVNAVAPGFIRTRMTENLPEEVKKGLMLVTPMARFGEPEEVAKVMLFLASEDVAYVTGQVIGVNGGMYM
jgi:3-oxoacyl-[acyl-carrier protein] reductase